MLVVSIVASTVFCVVQSAAAQEDQDVVSTLERDLPAHLTVRLAEGNITYGRVEVLHDGVWGSICDDQWDVEDGQVVCRQLGFLGAAEVYHGAAFGQGAGPIWLDSVDCKGDEIRIESCSHNGWNVTNCKHEEDAGVACLESPSEVQLLGLLNTQAFQIIQQSKLIKQRQEIIDQILQTLESLRNDVQPVQLYDGIQQTELGQLQQQADEHLELLQGLANVSIVPVRLAGNNVNEVQGRVEVYYDGQWGTICDDNWGMEEANIVCSQLGFPQAREATRLAAFGEGTGTIWLDDLDCLGNETSLSQCAHKAWGDHNCKHEEDAGVVCYDRKAGFSVSLTNGIGPSPTDVIFDVINANVGSQYDVTSGKFRAPIDGHYIFFFHGYKNSTNGMHVDLMVNGAVYKGQWVDDTDTRDGYDTASNSIIIFLSMGDEVNIRLPDRYYLNGGFQTSFSGFLLSAA